MGLWLDDKVDDQDSGRVVDGDIAEVLELGEVLSSWDGVAKVGHDEEELRARTV